MAANAIVQHLSDADCLQVNDRLIIGEAVLVLGACDWRIGQTLRTARGVYDSTSCRAYRLFPLRSRPDIDAWDAFHKE